MHINSIEEAVLAIGDGIPCPWGDNDKENYEDMCVFMENATEEELKENEAIVIYKYGSLQALGGGADDNEALEPGTGIDSVEPITKQRRLAAARNIYPDFMTPNAFHTVTCGNGPELHLQDENP